MNIHQEIAPKIERERRKKRRKLNLPKEVAATQQREEENDPKKFSPNLDKSMAYIQHIKTHIVLGGI